MPKRSSPRYKVVLPVSVIRSNGKDKQLAHTLDIATTSARLGGLTFRLDPGEVIEILRGTSKAKFQVIWTGAPGSAMEGQAGVRGIDQEKSIWGVKLPEQQGEDQAVPDDHRSSVSPIRTEPLPQGEKRWFERYACSGAVTVKPVGPGYPISGNVSDVSQGGLYMETISPWPVNAKVSLNMRIDSIEFQAKGVVRTSHPMVGMGICFQEITPDNREKLSMLLKKLMAKAPAKTPAQVAAPVAMPVPAAAPAQVAAPAHATVSAPAIAAQVHSVAPVSVPQAAPARVAVPAPAVAAQVHVAPPVSVPLSAPPRVAAPALAVAAQIHMAVPVSAPPAAPVSAAVVVAETSVAAKATVPEAQVQEASLENLETGFEQYQPEATQQKLDEYQLAILHLQKRICLSHYMESAEYMRNLAPGMDSRVDY